MACCVDFHFDFSSPYGFLTAMKIERALPHSRYRRLIWRPFLLGAVYQRFGQSPLEHPLKRRYVLEIDAPRVGRRDGLRLKVPAGFPQHSLPAARAFYWIEARAPEKAPDFAKTNRRSPTVCTAHLSFGSTASRSGAATGSTRSPSGWRHE
jgi:2-hydroxychromene-2-carboxylate isomerase